MKTTILMLLLATAGFAEVAAKVPFPFEAGGVKFPGGQYALTTVSATQSSAWLLRNTGTGQGAIVIRRTQGNARAGEGGTIRFRCTDAGRCALVEFWQPGQLRNVLTTPGWVNETASDRLVALGR